MKWALGVVLLLPRVAAAEVPAASFNPDDARPFFDETHAGDAIRRFHKEDWAGAAKAFADWLLAEGPKKESARAPQARFLEAFALSKAGRFEDAARLFDELARSYPLLADYHHLYAARALLGARRFEKSLERSRLVEKNSVLDAEARFARAEALEELGLLVEAEHELRGYVQTYPSSWREAEVLFRLAEVIDRRSQKARPGQSRIAEAKDLYRQVYIRFPTQNAAKLAEARLRTLDAAALGLGGPEQVTRGLALFEQMRNAESEAAFRAALAAGGLDATQGCVAAYNLAQSVFKARDRPRAAPLFDTAARACENAPKSDATAADLAAKSLYQAGRCHAAKDETTEALAAWGRLEAEHATHSYADDARLRKAELLRGAIESLRAAKQPPTDEKRARITVLLGNPAPAAAGYDELARLLEAREEEILSSIATAYAGGDQGGEALFRLGFHALEAGNLDGARAWIEKELRAYPREDGWWEAGRTLYWLARIAERQGQGQGGGQAGEASAARRAARAAEARFYDARCAREYPLSYYSLAALNRLRETAPDEEKKLVAELGAAPGATTKPADSSGSEKPGRPATPAPGWHFAPSPLFASAAFRRGVELARLGLGTEARRELAAAGIKVPERRGAKVEGAAAEELLWVAAVLYDGAGEWALSHFIPRHVLTAYAASWPVGENRKRWLLSYPEGYADLIIENAVKNGQPAALEFAIVREESAFDPGDESFANAVGLTQLTQAPAKRFAQGLPYSREALKDPVVNVTIGARELGDLWKRAGGIAALAIAGYNAGDGAVRRWLRAAPAGQHLDEFIERIPFDETRGYTKRVLGTWFAYHWLYEEKGDPVPPLGNALPSSM